MIMDFLGTKIIPLKKQIGNLFIGQEYSKENLVYYFSPFFCLISWEKIFTDDLNLIIQDDLGKIYYKRIFDSKEITFDKNYSWNPKILNIFPFSLFFKRFKFNTSHSISISKGSKNTTLFVYDHERKRINLISPFQTIRHVEENNILTLPDQSLSNVELASNSFILVILGTIHHTWKAWVLKDFNKSNWNLLPELPEKNISYKFGGIYILDDIIHLWFKKSNKMLVKQILNLNSNSKWKIKTILL